MKLHRQEEEWLRLELLRAIINTQMSLVRIELNLEVLGSEFSPYLHEADAQLDQLRERIQHHALGNESEKNGGPAQESGPPSNPDAGHH